MLRAQLAEAKADDVLVPAARLRLLRRPTATATTSSSGRTRPAPPSGCASRTPASSKEPFLCIADFFRPAAQRRARLRRLPHRHHGRPGLRAHRKELFDANKYQEYLLLHGIGVEMAEALAEYWHHRIREEWGFVDEDGPTLTGLFRQQYRGGRYSWGYPACPDLEDNEKVAELLDAGRIGIEVNEETGFQYQPEQTTSAIICHHPKAKYFVAK